MQTAFPDIPGYTLLEKLGGGGMGEVFRAREVAGAGREVALKLLGAHQSVQTFQRESQAMQRLAHANVVELYAWGETSGRRYLAMEYVAGTTLRTKLEAGTPWPWDAAAKLVATIGAGLSHIHAHGILHLDLKPENVLCGNGGETKITDFGIAHARADIAGAGTASGTLDYCPPEQRYGLPLDERTDLFALATIAYEMLTGRLPGRVYVSIGSRDGRSPAPIDAVLKCALARDPDERFATVDEFCLQLRAAVAA